MNDFFHKKQLFMKSELVSQFILFLILIISTIVLIIPNRSEAAEPLHNKVRVGYYNNSFLYRNEDGTFSGYGYEYLQEISKYTGWEYEMVYGGLSQCHEWLQEGKIDLICYAQYTDERNEVYDFSAHPSINGHTVIVTKEDSDISMYNEMEALDGKIIGAVKGALDNMIFGEYIKNYAIDLRKVEFVNQSELDMALDNGEVDLAVTTSFTKRNSEKIILKLGLKSAYFITKKGNTPIVDEISRAQENIYLIETNYNSNLYQKYYGNENSSHFVLAREERELVNNTEPLRVAVLPDWKPVQYFDSETGEYAGVFADIFKTVSKISELQFEFIQVDTYEEGVTMLEKGKVDMLSGVYEYMDIYRKSDLNLVSNFTSSRLVSVMNKTTANLENARVAVPHGAVMPRELEHVNIEYYDTIYDCINAVNENKADFTFGNIYVVENVVQDGRFNNVVVSNMPSEVCSLSVLFNKSVDRRVRNIFDKAVDFIPNEEKQDIIYNNTTKSFYDKTVENVSYSKSHITGLIIIFAVITLVICTTFLSIIRVKAEKSIIAKTKFERDRLKVIGDISNEILMEYDVNTDVMTTTEKYTEVFGRENIIPHFTSGNLELQYIYEDDVTNYMNFCKELKTGVDFLEMDIRMIDRIGNYVWCHIYGKSMLDSDGKYFKFVGKMENVEIQKRELEKLLFRSQRDTLTGAYNKNVTKEKIDTMITDEPDSMQFALLLIDIDNFAEINEVYGTYLGDSILTNVVSHIRAMFREEDIIGRIGGDEFVIFMKNIKSQEQVLERAKDLSGAFSNKYREDDIEVEVTGSIGIALCPIHGTTYDELYIKADKSLYVVKENGKNGYGIYSE